MIPTVGEITLMAERIQERWYADIREEKLSS
jgi:hypothetical protein